MSAADQEVFCCCFKRKRKEAVVAAALAQPEAASPVAVNSILETFASGALPIDSRHMPETQKVPFAADLPKDLNVGKAICVSGLILPKCSRFAVNLTCGKTPQADVAFHLNPRLLQRYVVRNSRLGGQWGPEEKTSTVKWPFGRGGSKFQLCIAVGDGEFLVAVDGVHFCTYKFRVAWGKVKAIDVQGDVDVLNVEYKPLEKYPEVGELTQEVKVVEGSKKSIEDGPRTGLDPPVTFLLPRGFRQDWQLEIYGRVKILPHSFYVNLQEGAGRWPHPNIPLHLNPRFGLGTGEPLFVRNAWIDNGWGQEERTPGFQFEPGSPFTMAIRRGEDHFSVWIDGKLAGEFKFRGSVDNIDTVHIEGDVVIFDVLLGTKNENLATLDL